MRPVRSTPVDIPVRTDLEFDFAEVPAVHTADNPLISHLWNALSMLAPTFEKAAIKVLRQALKGVTAPALERDVDAFIRQEALHSRHHSALNSHLGRMGADVAAFKVVGQNAWDEAMDGLSPKRQLATIVAAEHLIHELSVVCLSTPGALAGMHPEVRRLISWHLAEEIEHQSVASDVYRHLYGDGPRDWAIHAAALWSARGVFLTYAGRIQSTLLSVGPAPTAEQRSAYRRYLWSTPGVLRKVGLRSLRHAAPWSTTWRHPGELELVRIALQRVV
jgi:predicted metal-dependent hydrolase